MSILEESDFVITQKGGNYKAMNLNISNILKSNDQPAIVGGGKNIFTKNNLGIPFGLAVMNNFMPKNTLDGGNKKIKHNKEMQLIKDELYDELLSLCQRTERAKKGIRTKTRSKKSKKPKRKKTRKK
mgnify:CR=1 FL=1|jgi:hypothetical protein